ncbi:MAG: DNA recombination protein RmuC [Gemmatimonadaceae bacterium]|nr:DNA recombination protein RmuC [Gemmatimonadaceae bacterium]
MTDSLIPLAAFAIGAALGAVLAWWAATRVAAAERVGATAAAQAQLSALTDAQHTMRATFETLAADALRHSQEAFLTATRAELTALQADGAAHAEAREQTIATLLQPVRELLASYDTRLTQLDRDRTEALGQVAERLLQVHSVSDRLGRETRDLVQALRAPSARGRWGELQLQRVVELAGMLEYCDFETQLTMQTADGVQRPDMVVRLPGGSSIVVDAKAPLEGYLAAMDASDEPMRLAALDRHAKQLRAHIAALSDRNYWRQFTHAPEFVVLFLPGEAFHAAALERDPSLLEAGVAQRVLIASPTTLIALLRAAAYGWRQERVAESAAQVSALGRELAERLAVFTSHLADVGSSLDQAVTRYNRAVGSFDARVLVAARRFTDLGAGPANADALDTPPQLERQPRSPALPNAAD